MFDTALQLECNGRMLRLDVPRVMGIVNVTPDSFSDGGAHDSSDAAIAHGLRLAERAPTSSTSVANPPARARLKCRSKKSCGACCR